MAAIKFTVVQHSGFGYNPGNPQFERGLEPRMLDTARQLASVRKAGGLVLDNYMAAEDYTDAEMYPEGYGGLTPAAPGTFARAKIDGLRIYVPRV